MSQDTPAPSKPRLGVGSLVSHPVFGRGKVVDYEHGSYVVLFKGAAEAKRVAFSLEALKAEDPHGDAELDRVRQAVREVLGDCGWLDVDVELGKRWAGGTLKLIPGSEATQSKEVPIEVFLKKIISIRDKLRVLEQKLNAHPTLSPEEKLEFEGYITRCYGSLTTFNALFATKESQFKGSGKEDSE